MLHRTVWDAPSASSKKEVSFKPETELGYVTSNCIGRSLCTDVLLPQKKSAEETSVNRRRKSCSRFPGMLGTASDWLLC